MEKIQKDPLLLFPCPGCNAQLYFSPQSQQLQCEYCGFKVPIEKATDHIKENNLRQQLTASGNADAAIEQLVNKCNRCGSETVFISEAPTFICSFCNFEVVNPVAYKTRIIQPAGIIPFRVDKQQSVTIFKNWLGKGWWAPRDLTMFARQDSLHGIYLPFWTYDAQTHSEWTGYGGRYYYETVEETDSNGKKTTRQVQHTEWIYRSGTYDNFFDDIMVGGSKELPANEYESVLPYELNELVNFDSSYLSGFQADVYDITLNDGYTRAEQIMDAAIYNACVGQCTIDTYRDVQVDTTFSNQTYKHVLLPLWFCTYLYKNKHYHFLVNGQTGKTYGKKPVSVMKVIFVILLAVLAIIAFVVIAGQD